ncbi:MAG: hypothetical protein WAZ34_15525 [Rhodocyclaceae bacterium]
MKLSFLSLSVAIASSAVFGLHWEAAMATETRTPRPAAGSLPVKHTDADRRLESQPGEEAGTVRVSKDAEKESPHSETVRNHELFILLLQILRTSK